MSGEGAKEYREFDYHNLENSFDKLSSAVDDLTSAHMVSQAEITKQHIETMLQLANLTSAVSTIHERGCTVGHQRIDESMDAVNSLIERLNKKIDDDIDKVTQKLDEHKKEVTRLAILAAGIASSLTGFLSWLGLKS